jgi:hypothetical protein
VRYACLVAALLCACSKKLTPIAELTKAEGPVEREDASGTRKAAALGTKYFIGDAAHTAESLATLQIGGAGGAQIRMQRKTTLRFGGRLGESKIAVEGGAIDLSGTGS